MQLVSPASRYRMLEVLLWTVALKWWKLQLGRLKYGGDCLVNKILRVNKFIFYDKSYVFCLFPRWLDQV